MVCPEPMISNGKAEVESATSEGYLTGGGVTPVYSFDVDYKLRNDPLIQRKRVIRSERAAVWEGDDNKKYDVAGGKDYWQPVYKINPCHLSPWRLEIAAFFKENLALTLSL